MTAILGGLGAAFVWATSTLATSRSTKIVTPTSVLASVMTIGVVLTAPFAIGSGVPEGLGVREVAWLATAGVVNLGGLLLAYMSYRIGRVGVVAATTSAQGAAAAVIAVLFGETIAPGAGLMLGLIAVGVALASASGTAAEVDEPRDRRAVLLSTVAAVLLGLGLFATGRVSNDVPLPWIVFLQRSIGVLVFALPMTLLGRVRLRRRAIPYIVASGILEIVGLVAFTIGARESIAVVAIVSSQFAALAAVGAYVAFGERLRRVQVVGVSAIVVGVAVLTGLQA